MMEEIKPKKVIKIVTIKKNIPAQEAKVIDTTNEVEEIKISDKTTKRIIPVDKTVFVEEEEVKATKISDRYKDHPNYKLFLRFEERFIGFHGNKFDYSQTNPNSLLSYQDKSKINIVCNLCKFEDFDALAKNYFKIRNCSECGGKEINARKILAVRNMPKIADIHRDHINYDLYVKFENRFLKYQGDKFDYSKTNPDNLVSNLEKSKINISCNNCKYEHLDIAAKNYFRIRECANCHGKGFNQSEEMNIVPIKKVTECERIILGEKSKISDRYKNHPEYELYLKFEKKFLEFQKDKFDYSLTIPDNLQTTLRDSRINVVCTNCGESELNAPARNFFKIRDCKKCKGKEILNTDNTDSRACNVCKEKYNINIAIGDESCFLCAVDWSSMKGIDYIKIAKRLHGDKYDYSAIDDSAVIGSHKKVQIICVKCKHNSCPEARYHLRSGGNCGNCKKWNYNKLISRLMEVHGNKYNYGAVNEKDVVGKKSLIIVSCNACGNKWSPTIDNHISGSDCPRCQGNEPWYHNIEKFIWTTSKVHGNKYDYSDVCKEDLINKSSRIHISCNDCQYDWYPTINNHIAGYGCPKCTGNEPWKNNMEKFKALSYIVHRKNYNYSNVSEKNLVDKSSEINIICNKCNREFVQSIANHINRGHGCPFCKSSKGEQKCVDYLIENNIIFKPQFILEVLSRKRYDFMFHYNDEIVFLEYDGQQHFQFESFFHTDEDEFYYRQSIDVLKTRSAASVGKIIRIDYTQINNIGYHIEKGLQSKEKMYFSNEEMYSYIIDEL